MVGMISLQVFYESPPIVVLAAAKITERLASKSREGNFVNKASLACSDMSPEVVSGSHQFLTIRALPSSFFDCIKQLFLWRSFCNPSFVD